METCNPLLGETEGGGEEDEKRRCGGGTGEEMVEDMWDGGLEEGDFSSLREFITGVCRQTWKCWGDWVEQSKICICSFGVISSHQCITQRGEISP